MGKSLNEVFWNAVNKKVSEIHGGLKEEVEELKAKLEKYRRAELEKIQKSAKPGRRHWAGRFKPDKATNIDDGERWCLGYDFWVVDREGEITNFQTPIRETVDRLGQEAFAAKPTKKPSSSAASKPLTWSLSTKSRS